MATPADEHGHFSGSRCRKVAVLPAGGITRREDERVLETVQRSSMLTLPKARAKMALSVFDAMLHGRASRQCYPPVAHTAVN